jgi:2'-5' RNA ligase
MMPITSFVMQSSILFVIYSQKYCLVQFLKPIEIGVEFASSQWPPHVTIAGVFALEWSEALLDAFTHLIADQSTFTSTTEDIAHFGPEGNVTVRLLAKTPELQQLHERTVDLVEINGGIFNEPHYLRHHFRPHITLTDGSDITKWQTVHFTKLALIDMFPGGDHTQRRVLKTFPIQKP